MPIWRRLGNSRVEPHGGPMPLMRYAQSVAILVLVAALAPRTALAQQDTATAYYEFMMARRLETAGKTDAALAALERAAAADPTSAEIKAEIASVHLRRTPPNREAGEKAAKEALALDEKNAEANRTLGYLYANAVDTGSRHPARPFRYT